MGYEYFGDHHTGNRFLRGECRWTSGQVETGSVISYSSAILKKISDEEILLAFQQKYSYLSDSSNMQNITNRIVEELIIINDSDDPSERSQVLAGDLPSEEEKRKLNLFKLNILKTTDDWDGQTQYTMMNLFTESRTNKYGRSRGSSWRKRFRHTQSTTSWSVKCTKFRMQHIIG